MPPRTPGPVSYTHLDVYKRQGQGGGSYDRALVHVRPDVDIVTLLWDDELLDTDVPAEPHDRRVTAVLTPGRGLIRLG